MAEFLVKEPADMHCGSLVLWRQGSCLLPALSSLSCRGRRHGLVLPAWTAICHKAGGNEVLALGNPPQVTEVAPRHPPGERLSPNA